MSTVVEIELKVRVDSHEPVRATLAAAGAARIGTVLETNHFFDTPVQTMLHRGAGLRVREAIRIDVACDTDSGPACHSDFDPTCGTGVPPVTNTVETPLPQQLEKPQATMTFKGPQQAGQFKTRGEIEFAISSAAGAIALITAIGFVETLRFAKRRESWRLDDCEVELDELPRLGRYVEIEGPTDDAIRAVALKLGLDPTASIRESYAALLAATADPTTPRPMVIAFE